MRKPQSLYEWLRLGATGVALYQAAEAYTHKTLAWKRARHDAKLYSVSISAADNMWMYRDISRWAFSHAPAHTRHEIDVLPYDGEFTEIPREADEVVYVPFKGTHIRFWWHQVNLDPESKKFPTQWLTMTAPTLQLRDELLTFLADKFLAEAEQEIHVYRSVKAGGWNHVRQLTPRLPDSLILPDGMYDDMAADLTRFLGSQQAYFDRGIPWHRGFLMYGPPGTGKSSTIAVLANQFKRNVHFCSLADLESNSALIQCVSNLRGRSFLVLEDVDIVRSSHERSEEDGVTLDGLLNVLDGVLTPDGLVTFMTTNDREKLDSALIRPGRADRQFNLDYLTQSQLDRMIGRFIPDHDAQILIGRPDVVPAEIIECLKSSFDRPAEYILSCIEEVVSSDYQDRYVRPKAPDLSTVTTFFPDDEVAEEAYTH